MSETKQKPLEIQTAKLVAGVTEMIAMRKERSEGSKPELKYYPMYVNLDTMLCKLPEDEVDDLNVQFVAMAHAALKRQRNITE